MKPNPFHNSGLLEQYLLGLTSREESIAVEEYLARSPEARQELEHLRAQLGLYLEEVTVGEADKFPEKVRSGQLEAQEVGVLRARNTRLATFQTGLIALSILLLGTSFYYYRLSQNFHSAHIAEKARHVQDDHLHAREMKHLAAGVVHWDSLHTIVAASDHGNLQLHYLLADSMVLLDLSHLKGPDAGYAYHVHRYTDHDEQKLWIVDAGKVNALYPLDNLNADLRIIYGPAEAQPRNPSSDVALVAEVSLTDFSAER